MFLMQIFHAVLYRSAAQMPKLLRPFYIPITTGSPDSIKINPMKILRALHLYLGCIFAPMLILFAVTGFWQTLGLNFLGHPFIARLSTIHTGHGLKIGGSLSSIYMRWFVLAMAISLVFTIVLGIFMAFKFGHRRTAIYCLCGGIAVPLIFILLALR